MTQNRPDDSNLPVLPNAICVGQAFDIYGKYDPSSFMGSLFNPKASSSPQTVDGKVYLVPDYIEAINIAKDEEQKHSGTSREEFQQSIAASAKISTKYGAFSGQFSAGFSSVEHTMAEYMYAHTTYYDWIYQMQLRTTGELEPYLSDSFKQAVENLPDEAITPAQIAAFFRFFNTYGAYYTRQVAVGALLEFYVAVSTTSNLSASSVRAAMDAHYRGLFVTGSVSAEFQQTQIWQSYSQNSVIALRVSGGDDATRAKLSAIDEKKPGKDTTVEAYNQWKETKGTLPIVTYMQLAPIYNLCGSKAEIVAEAWGKIWPTLHPNMYIETTSEDSSQAAPVVVLSSKNQPITPTNPKTSNMGCMVALLSRKTLETLEARYYCFNQETWKLTYPTVFNQVAQDLLQSNYYNHDSVLVFVTMGLVGYAARPTSNLYSLLLLAGAGKGLQAWKDTPETYVNYVLVGIPTIGAGKGAESYATNEKQPGTMSTGAYFYKSFSAQLYDVALNPNPISAQLTTGSEEEQASQHPQQTRTDTTAPVPSMDALTHENTRTPEEILAYWTPERMAQARPVSPPSLDGQASEDHPQRVESPASAAPVELGAMAYYTTGKVPLAKLYTYPYRSVGKLLFTIKGEDREGSAAVVAENGLITAAHNLYDHKLKAWAENILFYPAYDKGFSQYGFWTAKGTCVPVGWQQTKDLTLILGYDVGFISLERGGTTGDERIGKVVEQLPLLVDMKLDPSQPPRWEALGYPGKPQPGYAFNGEQMWVCYGDFEEQWDNIVYKGGNLTEGASGGPWLFQREKGDYSINGIQSTTTPTNENTDSSPYFGTWVEALFIQCFG